MENITCTINNPNIIKFPRLGLEFNIDPTALNINGFKIQWYGIIITVGLGLATLYCFSKLKRFDIESNCFLDVVIGSIIGGVIGARFYYVIMKWKEYKNNTFKETFLAVINIRNGGLAIYGGIIGAVIIIFIICKIYRIRVLPMLDIMSIGVLIGQGIGRWGNFVNQEAFGTNTKFIFGMTGGKIQNSVSMITNMTCNNPVHPCFLYESVWCLLGFTLVAFLSKRRKYDGQLILIYMAWYGFERFIVEELRIDSLMVKNIRVSQVISALIFVSSVLIQIIIFFRIKYSKKLTYLKGG